MNTVVCIKMVPEVHDAELAIIERGAAIDTDELVWSINEWDNFAVEEAVRLKEAHGGTVTVVTLGEEEAEDVLRRALAMGADAAVQIDADDFEGSDGAGLARALAAVVGRRSFDLVLCGAQSADRGAAEVGPMVARLLDIPFAALAVGIELDGAKLLVRRELESNTQQRVELDLPALVTVQSGINQPRYVSVMGIRKVRRLEIEELSADELDLDEDDIGAEGSGVASTVLAEPDRGEGAQMLSGSLDEICNRAAAIIRRQGGAA